MKYRGLLLGLILPCYGWDSSNTYYSNWGLKFCCWPYLPDNCRQGCCLLPSHNTHCSDRCIDLAVQMVSTTVALKQQLTLSIYADSWHCNRPISILLLVMLHCRNYNKNYNGSNCCVAIVEPKFRLISFLILHYLNWYDLIFLFPLISHDFAFS